MAEEVGDLLEHVRDRSRRSSRRPCSGGCLCRRPGLFVSEALVEHLKHADGANLHDAAGEAGGVDEDEDVEGVAIVGEGGGDEAVVAGVVDWGVEITVEAEDVEFLVVLVLVDSFEWNLDDSVDHLGRVGAHGELKVVRHRVGISFVAKVSR